MKIFAVIDEAPRFIDIFASEIFSSAEKVKQLVALSLIQDQSIDATGIFYFYFPPLTVSSHLIKLYCPLSKDPILGYVSIY